MTRTAGKPDAVSNVYCRENDGGKWQQIQKVHGMKKSQCQRPAGCLGLLAPVRRPGERDERMRKKEEK